MADEDDVQAPDRRQGVRGGKEGATDAKASGEGQAAIAISIVIRRPRFPLTLRLAWLESEIDQAARLLPMLIADLKQFRQAADGTDAKVLLVASVAVTALLPFGVDPLKCEGFLDALVDGGDLERAEALAAELLQDVLLGLFRPDGEGH